MKYDVFTNLTPLQIVDHHEAEKDFPIETKENVEVFLFIIRS